MDRPKRTITLPAKYTKPIRKIPDESEEEFDDSYETEESDFDETMLTDSEELSEDESHFIINKCS